jgi:hypothetical protein
MDPDKREIRQLKRKLKQLGNQRLRRQLRRTLAENPDAAHEVEPDFGRFRTAELNGYDHDATRRRHQRPAVEVEDEAESEDEPETSDD